MRKRVVSLGLALVMALGISGVSGVSEVRAEYKSIKIIQDTKVVKSKRGEMPKFLKESGVKAVKDDSKHIWLDKDGDHCDEKNTYYTIEAYTDGTYGIRFGDDESREAYGTERGLTDATCGFYCEIKPKSWKADLESAKKYVPAIAAVFEGTNTGDDMKERKIKHSIVLREVKKGVYEWVGTYSKKTDVTDVRGLKLSYDDYRVTENELNNKYVKYKIVQKVLKEGVSVKIEPISISTKYLNGIGLKAPVKVEKGMLEIYDSKGNFIKQDLNGATKIPLGNKAGTYKFNWDLRLKDKTGKDYTVKWNQQSFKVGKVPSIKSFVAGWKPKVKVEKKKVYMVFGNKIKSVVINGHRVYSDKPTTKINISSVVTKNGTYAYEIYSEDGVVNTGKITVKGLK